MCLKTLGMLSREALLALVGRDAERRGVDLLVSMAREGSVTSPRVLDVSRAPGSVEYRKATVLHVWSRFRSSPPLGLSSF